MYPIIANTKSPAQPARVERGEGVSGMSAACLLNRNPSPDATKLDANLHEILAWYPYWALSVGTTSVLALICIGVLYATFMVPLPNGGGSFWGVIASLITTGGVIYSAWVSRHSLPLIARKTVEELKEKAAQSDTYKQNAASEREANKKIQADYMESQREVARLKSILDSLVPPKRESEG